MSKKTLNVYYVWKANSLERLVEDVNRRIYDCKHPLRIVYVEKMEIIDSSSGRIETQYRALIEETQEFMI